MSNLPTLANYNAGFYNSIVTALSLSPDNFQLTQGAFALPGGDPKSVIQLNRVLDSVPPVSVCNLFNPNSLNGLSGNIGNLLGYATTLEQNSFSYKQANNVYLDNSNWLAGGSGKPVAGENPVYGPTMAEILDGLQKNGSKANFSYDSATADTSLSNSWAKSSDYGGVGFWGKTTSSSNQQINAMAESSEVTVEMGLTFTSLPVEPGGWYFEGYLVQMYQNPGFWVAGPNNTNLWDTLFGPKGSLQYVSNQVYVATDIDIWVTSKASYSAEQYSQIQSSSDTNVWPFYTSSSSSSTTTDYTQNADGSITAHIKSKPGAIQIIGFGVISVQTEIQGS